MSSTYSTYTDSRLNFFAEKYHLSAHLMLAMQAAVPIALTPDLLYKLWLNFQHAEDGSKLKIPLIAIADILSSSICRKVGSNIFEIYPEIREELRSHLLAQPMGAERQLKIAEFIQSYLDLCRDKIPTQVLYDALHVNSLSIIDPSQALIKIMSILKDQQMPNAERIAKANTQLDWTIIPRTEGGGNSFLKSAKEIIKSLHEYYKGDKTNAIKALTKYKNVFQKEESTGEGIFSLQIKQNLFDQLAGLEIGDGDGGSTDSSFLTKEQIKTYYLEKIKTEDSEKVKDLLLIFKDEKEQDWLIATNKRVICINDDDGNSETQKKIKLELPHSLIGNNVGSKMETINAEVGVFNIGSEDCRVSLKLFESLLEAAVLDIREFIRLAAYTYLSEEPNYGNTFFLGRDKELEDLHQMTLTNDTVIQINGHVGCGKTEFAKIYLLEYGHFYDHVIWIQQEGTLEQSFLKDEKLVELFSEKHIGNTSPEYSFIKEFANDLKQIEGRNLLVIDNASEDSVDDYADLQSWQIILISQERIFHFRNLNLNVLSREKCKEVFEYYYKKEADDELVDRLLGRLDLSVGLVKMFAVVGNKLNLSLKYLLDGHHVDVNELWGRYEVNEYEKTLSYLETELSIQTNFEKQYPTSWDHITVRLNGEGTVSFQHIRDGTPKMYSSIFSRGRLEDLLAQISQSSDFYFKSMNTLVDLLIPQELKSVLEDSRDIILNVDGSTFVIPWELIFFNRKNISSLSLESHTIIRQFSLSANRSISKVVSEDTALLVANSKLSQLDRPVEEIKIISDLLVENSYEVTNSVNDDISLLLATLYKSKYKILHLSGFGEFSPASNEKGINLGGQLILDASTIRQMETVPNLVFINGCHEVESSSRQKNWFMGGECEYAATIGSEFYDMGVKAIVVAGWKLEKEAAKKFTEAFYKEMLNGKTFGDAVKVARKTCYDLYSETSTWGAFQCYGDPFYKLTNNKKDSQEGIFTDSRDNLNYKTIQLKDGNTWLAQNFNFDATDESWIYNNDSENETRYGRLYTWEGVLKACPKGWHVPTAEEWRNLIDLYREGNRSTVYESLIEGGSSNLDLRLGGTYTNGRFIEIDDIGDYWSSNESDVFNSWVLDINKKVGKLINILSFGKATAFSCRFVKNKDGEEEKEWAEVVSINTEKSYRDFYNKYPSGKNSSMAKMKIEGYESETVDTAEIERIIEYGIELDFRRGLTHNKAASEVALCLRVLTTSGYRDINLSNLHLGKARREIVLRAIQEEVPIASLEGVDLPEADLSNANLANINLQQANLRRSRLKKANLENVNLYNADLSNANLVEANLQNAKLFNANLKNSNLDRAELDQVEVNGSQWIQNLNALKVNGVKWIEENYFLTPKDENNDPGVYILEKYKDDIDWKIAIKENNIAAFEHFLKVHPKSKFVQEAHKLIKELKNKDPKYYTTPKEDIGEYIDRRDRQSYKTVKLKDGNTWMAENFNFKVDQSKSYSKTSRNKRFGLLYTWDGAQSACPPGWHLPSLEDWTNLKKAYGDDDLLYLKLEDGGKTSFNALLVGHHNTDGVHLGLGNYGRYWLSDESKDEEAYYFYFIKSSGQVGVNTNDKNFGFSCRYIKNDGKYEQDHWKKITQINTTEIFERYLRDFPEGKHRDEAQKRIDDFIEGRLWNEVLKQTNRTELERYLKDYPNGQHVEVANDMLSKIEEEEAEESNEKVSSIKEFSFNNTLMGLELTGDRSNKVLKGVSSLQGVFNFFIPKVDVVLNTFQGDEIRHLISFKRLDHFTVESIIDRTNLLSKLSFFESVLIYLREKTELLPSSNFDTFVAYQKNRKFSILGFRLYKTIALKSAKSKIGRSEFELVRERFELLDEVFDLSALKKLNHILDSGFEKLKDSEEVEVEIKEIAWLYELDRIFENLSLDGNEFLDRNEFGDFCYQNIQKVRKCLHENIRKLLSVAKTLERNYRALNIYFKTVGIQKKSFDLTLINVKDVESPRGYKFIESRVVESSHRYDNSSSYGFIVVPELITSLEYLQRIINLAYSNNAILITDYYNHSSVEESIDHVDRIKSFGFGGIENFWSSVGMAYNWVIGRKSIKEYGETEDLYLPPSILLNGLLCRRGNRFYNLQYKGLVGNFRTRLNLRESDADFLSAKGLIVANMIQSELVFLNDRTLYLGQQNTLSRLSAIRTLKWIKRYVLNCLNQFLFTSDNEENAIKDIKEFLVDLMENGAIKDFEVNSSPEPSNMSSSFNLELNISPIFTLDSVVMKFYFDEVGGLSQEILFEE